MKKLLFLLLGTFIFVSVGATTNIASPPCKSISDGPWTECTGSLKVLGLGQYVGNWKDGQQHGLGWFSYDNGSSYLGDWVEGLKQGTGLFSWSNGDKYDGA